MDDDLLGRQLDEYRLEALLGQGGMARVYRGLDTRLMRHVAVKVIDAPFRADSDYALRFEREAQAIARLEHPHIVRLYRYGEAHGLLYMAMQYVEGADLGFVLASYQADREFIGPEDSSRIIREVCLALDYAHSRGVIHRDVKPSNIMLDKQGRAILTDFGLALLTEVGTRGQILGSPRYIAPEQAISSAKAVPQSDLYAVGVILYEMFTGQLPFDAAEPMDVALMHISETPRPPRELRPAISPDLEAVILKCLAKEPGERYPNGAALADALDQALRAKPTQATPLTARSLTIPERVALELAEHPLPLVPAAVAEPAPPPSAPELGTPKAPPSALATSRPLILIGSGVGVIFIGLVAVACGLLVAWLAFTWMGGRGIPSGPTSPTETAPFVAQTTATAPAPGPTLTLASEAALQASVTLFLPPVMVSSTPTASPAATTQLTRTPMPLITPTPLSSPTETPTGYELLSVRGEDDNSLIVVNQESPALPLVPLRIGDGPGAIHGTEWEVDRLESGACVTAWKNDEDRDLPEGLTCNVVGERLVREGKHRFWRDTFDVYYNEERVGTCEKAQQECSIHISP